MRAGLSLHQGGDEGPLSLAICLRRTDRAHRQHHRAVLRAMLDMGGRAVWESDG
ncbi:hypothetical protein [Kitasatospora sp. CMC57]|uniref:hypothetical protein n=1 Tax=Kitasatospora sp. CMC57 TaxID=3231513 RepID=UPI0038B65099